MNNNYEEFLEAYNDNYDMQAVAEEIYWLEYWAGFPPKREFDKDYIPKDLIKDCWQRGLFKSFGFGE